jgi:uncharacterized protein (DUF2062 family)
MSFRPGGVEDRSESGSAMFSRCRRTLEDLAGVDSPPRRTAAALACGVFLSFSPFLGLQILLGLTVAFAFRLSRVAVLIGLCANLPWIMLPWYASTTAAAAVVLGISAETSVSAQLAALFSAPATRAAFWGQAGELAGALLWPFLIGPTAGAVVLGAATYAIASRVLTRRAARKAAAPLPVLPGDAQQ